MDFAGTNGKIHLVQGFYARILLLDATELDDGSDHLSDARNSGYDRVCALGEVVPPGRLPPRGHSAAVLSGSTTTKRTPALPSTSRLSRTCLLLGRVETAR